MKIIRTSTKTLTSLACLTLLTMSALSEDKKVGAQKINKNCPITGKAANPKCNTKYEGVTYAFCSGACCKKFTEDRANSLYHKIGGKAAVNATIDKFYVRVLADKRVNHFFEDISMKAQHKKQKAFVSAALGSPVPYTYRDMRKAHEDLDIKESDFNAIAENLQITLRELKVKDEYIKQIIAIVATTKDDVLNRKKSDK